MYLGRWSQRAGEPCVGSHKKVCWTEMEGCGARYGERLECTRRGWKSWYVRFAFVTQGGCEYRCSKYLAPGTRSQISKATFSMNTTEHKTTLLSFHSLWSLARLFPTHSNFEHPGLHIGRFFFKATKEFSNRRRADLTAGDVSVICISILEAQDFKLKIQNPTSLYFFSCVRENGNSLQGKKPNRNKKTTTSSRSSPKLPSSDQPERPARAWGLAHGGEREAQRYSRFSSRNACQVRRYGWYAHVMVWIKSNLEFSQAKQQKHTKLH